jgi:hypothetical protein
MGGGPNTASFRPPHQSIPHGSHETIPVGYAFEVKRNIHDQKNADRDGYTLAVATVREHNDNPHKAVRPAIGYVGREW